MVLLMLQLVAEHCPISIKFAKLIWIWISEFKMWLLILSLRESLFIAEREDMFELWASENQSAQIQEFRGF